MLLSIHNIAERYGQLPSHVLASADTFDMHVLDLATRYEARQQAIRDGKPLPVSPNITQERMLDMIKQVKERKI